MATPATVYPCSSTPTPPLVPVHLLALPGACWCCGNEVRPIVGVLVPDTGRTSRFIEFASVADRLRVVVSEKRLRALGVGPIRRRATRLRRSGYLANTCVHCGAVQGEHPLREDLATFLSEGGRLRDLSIGRLILARHR